MRGGVASVSARRPVGARRRVAAAFAVVALLAVLAPLALAACGDPDPFAGVYWEPATGRRIEIRRQGDGYELYYGRDRRPFPAVRAGDRLTITDPMGGRTVVRPGRDEGTLELVAGGRTTVLRPVPQDP